MLCVKFVEIGPVILEKKILKFHNYFPVEEGGDLRLKKKPLKSPSPKDALCQVLLKLVLERKMKM